MTVPSLPDPGLLYHLPVIRTAYSSRTAWILVAVTQDQVEKQITAAAKDKRHSQIRELVLRVHANDHQANGPLLAELEQAGFSFVRGFNSRGSGTQAGLIQLNGTAERQPMVILAFRGTETKAMQDIKTDAKVELREAFQCGRVPPGFDAAFASVQAEIQSTLDQHGDSPLYITGHSLDGVLALVVSRYLVHPKSAATYTFGGPRVADEAFFADFRVPVYRVVNGADVVARLPFAEWFTLLLALIRLIAFNGTFLIAEWLRHSIEGYTHTGSGIDLSDSIQTLPDADGISYFDLVVKQEPEFIWRVQVTLTRLRRAGPQAFVIDHAIAIYGRKLIVQWGQIS